MADIIDIIHRLSYEVSGDGLDKAINKLQQQADVIDKLQKQIENLRIAQQNALNPNEYDKLTAAIAKNSKEVDARTKALTKSFTENKKLQAALNDEVGILQRLTELSQRLREERTKATNPKDIASLTQTLSQVNAEIKRLTTPNKSGQEIISKQELRTEIGYIEALENRVKILKNTLKSVPESDIARINQAIIQTENEIKRVKTPTTTGGEVVKPEEGFFSGNLINQILGLNSAGGIGRQLLTGTLYGLGIGGGIGVITRITDALVKYGEELFDTEGKAEKLAEANDKLTASFGKFGDEIEKEISDLKLLNVTANDLNDTVDAFQRKANAVKALGIINRDVYTAEKNQLEANNQLRGRELEDLQNQKNALQTITDIVDKSQKQAQSYFNRPEVKAFGDPTKNKNAQYDIYNTLLRNVTSSAIPDDIKQKITIELNKGYKDGADLLAVLNKETVQYQVNLVKVKQQIEDNKAATDAANQEFETKIREAADNKFIELLRANTKTQAEYNVQRLKDYDETAQRIAQILHIQRDQELKEVQDEINDERLKGELRSDVAEQYARKEAEIRNKYRLLEIEQIKAFVQKYTAIGDQIERAVISAAPNTLSALLNPDKPDIEKNIELSDARNKKLLADFEDFSTQLTQRAIKDGETQKEIDKELADYKLLVIQQTNKNIIAAYDEYYNQLAALNKKNADSLTLEQMLFHDRNSADVSAARLSGRISTGRYNYLSRLQSLYGNNDYLRNNIAATQRNLGAATSEFVNLSNNQNIPAGAERDQAIKDAQDKITALQDQLAKLQKQLTDNEYAIQHAQAENIKKQLDFYGQLVDTAVNAYKTIAEAHQRYLDVEISIQEERVREAQVIANRGNTAALQEQQRVLNEEQKQKEDAARREILIDQALIATKSILAVVNAVVDGDPYTVALRVAELIASLAAGYATVSALNSKSESSISFATGGYTGDGGKYDEAGTVHRGEFVMTKEATAKYRPLFEAIHKGFDPIPMLASMDYDNHSNKNSNKDILERLDNVEQAIKANRTIVDAHFDRHGMGIVTREAMAADRRRFKG